MLPISDTDYRLCLSCGRSETMGICGIKCCIMHSLLYTFYIRQRNNTSLVFCHRFWFFWWFKIFLFKLGWEKRAETMMTVSGGGGGRCALVECLTASPVMHGSRCNRPDQPPLKYIRVYSGIYPGTIPEGIFWVLPEYTPQAQTIPHQIQGGVYSEG